MAIFTAYTAVHNEGAPVFFAPGDEVPDWAKGSVGVHCMAESGESEAGESAPTLELEKADDADTKAVAVDFTGAKSPGRPRTRR